MQTELTACVIIAVLALAIAIISAICKHKKTFFVILLVALYFAVRSGIIYLALDYDPPSKKGSLDIEAPELEPIHFEYSLPQIEYFNNGKYGYGLDFLDNIKKDITDTNDEILGDIKKDAKKFLNSITSIPEVPASDGKTPVPTPVPTLLEQGVEESEGTKEPEEVVTTPVPGEEDVSEEKQEEKVEEPGVDESEDLSETSKVADENTGEVEDNDDGDKSNGD